MSARRKCGRNPHAGPGSCHHWWEGCQDQRKPPEGCFGLFARAIWLREQLKDVYVWFDPWRSPATGDAFPSPPSPAVEARQLPDDHLAQLIAVLPFPDVVDALRWERDRRRRVTAAP